MTPRLSGMFAIAVLLAATACKPPANNTAQHLFDTPEGAAEALITALEKNDAADLGRILGPGTDKLVSSGDAVADAAARNAFLQRYREQHRFVTGGPADLVMFVGNDDWPLPIPLVRSNNRWRFDGAAGTAELVFRRIGGNELRTIDVMHGFVVAQDEYAAASRDGAPAGIYAQRLQSTPGKHDGLYWAASASEAQSPGGPMLAAAAAEGYSAAPRAPYHGYLYRVLFAQGPDANGGARNYLDDGRLANGFALLAYPSVYGASGIMTFMVNQDGVVWQRDLGAQTAQLAAAIEQFNPDKDWTPLALEE